MFKRYLENESPKSKFPTSDGYQEVATEEKDSLLTLIESADWKLNEDRYYELEMSSESSEQDHVVLDEDRVYTQIRKVAIEYNERPATLLLIRNITHIVKYEKSKNVEKYQELLTGTMSHEMLTPLNAILNLIDILVSKVSSQSEGISTQKNEVLKLINLSKE
jgi:signal transduction histidine kinase